MLSLDRNQDSVQDNLDGIDNSWQPYLLAMETGKIHIHGCFLSLDMQAIACKSFSALQILDKLTYSQFCLWYSQQHMSAHVAIPTDSIYNIDIGEPTELRASRLH